MSNVVALRGQRQGLSAPLPSVPALVDIFATLRRDRRDAYWLKENAELLQVLAATGARVDLAPYAAYVPSLLDELCFFPQYYRLLLSIALDLRALGMPGVPVEAMVDQIVAQGLAEFELSDSHRAEARLLLQRASNGRTPQVDGTTDDAALSHRLARFGRQSALFCLPNRRAAYDLTHLVFHASDYGRRPIARCAERRQSLIHAGLVAWLEDNLDLLSEVAIALHLSGEAVPPLWKEAIIAGVGRFRFAAGPDEGPFDDDYHAYLVQNWALACFGRTAFAGTIAQGARLIRAPAPDGAALRDLSLLLLDMGPRRVPDWSAMRWRVWPRLSEAARARIAAVENMPEFAGFFKGFSRCGAGSGGK